MNEKKTNLFRQEALENNSERTGKGVALRAVGLKFALFTAALAVCAALFALWLIMGEVYETLSVDGIIWPSESGGEIYAEYGGSVSKVTVSRGARVKAGDILAVIPQEDILSDIESGAVEADAKLYGEYDRRSVIRSKTNGIVTYIADENTYVKAGEKIAEITPYDESGNNMTLIAFIPSDKGGLLSLGADAQVMPDFAPREKYGYINAYVSDIAQYPVKGEYIKENLGNLFLPSINEENNYLEVEITMLADAETLSHLKWSRPAGGDISAPMGTICTADIVIDKHHPYQWPF